MMASMGTTFSPHPGGMPHPPPGHPMAAPGMAHNPSQPGAQAGMPHQLVGHMGVSGPGGAQINPAALMGGMPPGAGGPNAHAMQHLNPAAQAQLFQQHNLNPMFANNPAAMQQHINQQRFQQLQAQQQHARQALMAQQYGVPMGALQMTGQMTPAQAAQIQAMRSMQQRPVALPPHLQQVHYAQQAQGQANTPHNQAMLAQQIALQQQQQLAANNQMAHASNPNQPGQMNPQQLQGLQQAQAQMQAAMAQAQAQQHAQAQAQSQQGQPQPAQAQPGQPQPQTPQQQPGQGVPGANLGQAHGQNQGPSPAQPNQQQAQVQPPTPQQNQAAHQAQLAQAQQQAAMNNSLLQQKRESMKGHCLLKLIQFGEHLSGFPGSKGKDDLSYWNDFVQRFFSPRGIFRHAIHSTDGEDQTDKQYEITYPALARYFHTHFDSGVKNMQLILDKGTMDRPLPGDCHFIENTKASLVYWFEGGSHLVATGTLRAQFDSEQRIELFEYLTSGHEEYISRKLVIQAAKPAHNWVKEWHRVNTQDNKQSPEMSKKGKPKQMKSPQNPPPDLDLPQSVVKQSVGITEAVHQFLEIVEIMGQMNPLFGFYHSHPNLAPYAALDQYVAQINPTGQNINGQVIGVQAGPRTPSFGQFAVNASPAAPINSALPGSPHVSGSPAPGQMQAPAMQLQASQQGTSSSGPSANTSPASNKRRRASAVKNEDEAAGSAATPAAAGTPQINGIQSKGKPPTPRMPKRVKTNPPAA